MQFVVTLAAVGLALTGGIAAGLWWGTRVRGRKGWYWALNIGAVLACMVLDFIGLLLGYAWLAYGALGLMAGLITGLKYGYSDAAAVWRARSAAESPADGDAPEDATDEEPQPASEESDAEEPTEVAPQP